MNARLASFMIASTIALGLPLGATAQPMKDGPGDCGGPMQMYGDPGMPDNRRPPDGAPGIPGENRLPPFLHNVQLSDVQRDKIANLMQSQTPDMRDQFKVMHQTQMALHQLSLSDDYSEAKAKTLAEANTAAMIRIAQMQARIDHQIYLLLTPEQRARLQQRKPQRDMP
ncbi:MAG: Spy/CpxP family protein refolding chaperone [Sulfuriferula sp.]|nr:Spy/CpxP family protein refolding chaperone [Sulfuriferula sp.]